MGRDRGGVPLRRTTSGRFTELANGSFGYVILNAGDLQGAKAVFFNSTAQTGVPILTLQAAAGSQVMASGDIRFSTGLSVTLTGDQAETTVYVN